MSLAKPQEHFPYVLIHIIKENMKWCWNPRKAQETYSVRLKLILSSFWMYSIFLM